MRKAYLHAQGPQAVRVRCHDAIARIEVASEELARFFAGRRISPRFRRHSRHWALRLSRWIFPVTGLAA